MKRCLNTIITYARQLGLLLLLLLTSCIAPIPTPPPATQPKPIPVAIAMDAPHVPVYLNFDLAQALGYLAEEGVAVELQ